MPIKVMLLLPLEGTRVLYRLRAKGLGFRVAGPGGLRFPALISNILLGALAS